MTSPLATILQAQISLHIARAAWWTAYATTPGNFARGTTYGDGTPLTREQLIDSAMQTADTHLRNAQETLDALNEETARITREAEARKIAEDWRARAGNRIT